jgi:hypothetical protein
MPSAYVPEQLVTTIREVESILGEQFEGSSNLRGT